jgi:hypothetical protein
LGDYVASGRPYSASKMARSPCLSIFAMFAMFANFANFANFALMSGLGKPCQAGLLQPAYNRCNSTNDRTTIITPEAVTATAATAGANRSMPDHRPAMARRSRKRPA